MLEREMQRQTPQPMITSTQMTLEVAQPQIQAVSRVSATAVYYFNPIALNNGYVHAMRENFDSKSQKLEKATVKLNDSTKKMISAIEKNRTNQAKYYAKKTTGNIKKYERASNKYRKASLRLAPYDKAKNLIKNNVKGKLQGVKTNIIKNHKSVSLLGKAVSPLAKTSKTAYGISKSALKAGDKARKATENTSKSAIKAMAKTNAITQAFASGDIGQATFKLGKQGASLVAETATRMMQLALKMMVNILKSIIALVGPYFLIIFVVLFVIFMTVGAGETSRRRRKAKESLDYTSTGAVDLSKCSMDNLTQMAFVFPVDLDGFAAVSGYFTYRSGRGDYHNGLDLASANGTYIYAMSDGVVETAYNDVPIDHTNCSPKNGRCGVCHGGCGRYVIINYGTLSDGNVVKSRYLHCSEVLVNVGDEVKKGQPVAKIGHTGAAWGYHTCFALIINSTHYNPMMLWERSINNVLAKRGGEFEVYNFGGINSKDPSIFEALRCQSGGTQSVPHVKRNPSDIHIEPGDANSVMNAINSGGGDGSMIVVEGLTPIPPSNTRYKDKDGNKYTDMGEYLITGYCPCPICCGNWSDGITASGRTAQANHTVAIDRRLFNMLDQMVIENIDGINVLFTAEDVGGAIKNKHIDMYFNTHQEALNWGKRYKHVYKKD